SIAGSSISRARPTPASWSRGSSHRRAGASSNAPGTGRSCHDRSRASRVGSERRSIRGTSRTHGACGTAWRKSCWPSRSPSIPKRHATPGVYPRAPRVEPLPDQGADSLDRPTRASHPLAAGSFPVQRSPGGDNDCHLYSVGVAARRGPLWHGRSPTRRGGLKSPVAAPLSPSQAGRDKPLRPLHFLPAPRVLCGSGVLGAVCVLQGRTSPHPADVSLVGGAGGACTLEHLTF